MRMTHTCGFCFLRNAGGKRRINCGMNGFQKTIAAVLLAAVLLSQVDLTAWQAKRKQKNEGSELI